MATEKRQRTIEKRKKAAKKLEKSQNEKLRLYTPTGHEHYYHDDAVIALNQVAKMMNPPIFYEDAKYLFVIENDPVITKSFWDIFGANHQVNHHTRIDFCHTCQKFSVYETARKPLSFENMLNIFAPYTEPMTDELYQELSAKGIPEEKWNELKSMGFLYNRARESFSAPENFLD
jgi:hypothetical protein